MSLLKKKLKSIKKRKYWKYFIQFLFYPVYHFFWQYFLNFNAKVLYFLWKFKKKKYIALLKNDKILITNNNNFTKIAKKIMQEAIPLLENSKKKILNPEYKKKLSNVNDADAEAPYRISLYESLSNNLKKEIVEFASSDLMVSTAAEHMGIFPILTRIQAFHNIPREGSKRRGAMYWHRDTFGFKNLDFFMAVTDMDEENGPFYCLEKKVKAGIFLSFSNALSRGKKGERGKVTLEEFSKYFKNENIIKLIGNSGTAIFLDSFSCYHRGGFCKSKDRVTLRFCYQSHDVIYDGFASDKDYYIYDQSIKKENTKDIFRKYLFFKKPSKIMNSFIKKIIRIYRMMEFKV